MKISSYGMIFLVGMFASNLQAAETQYDGVYRICGYVHSADQPSHDIEKDNLMSPTGAVVSYFFELNGELPNFSSGVGEPEPIQVNVLEAPAHGDLVPATKAAIYYIYYANPGYLGSDQMTFEVSVLGKRFKVVETIMVDDSGDLKALNDAAIETFKNACTYYFG